ncbi:MAG: response regulator [Planctomycetota bacterium]
MDNLRVLFVDDEEELAFTVVERLKFRGVDAQAATSGDEALQLIKEQDFDVIVLDVKMPGLGGFDVIRRIKQEHPDLVVIFLTGHGVEEDAQEGMRMGAFEYLMKPVDIDVLVEILHRAAKT